MSYVVFALKWRPKNFDEIVGQGHIVTQLKSAIQKGRLAHAYLFSGPRGVGKTSAARILAKALNCKEGPTVNPCNKCPSCLEIAQGRSLDVIEIDGASNRGIDEIRTLRENVKFAPTQGRYKVYIIDEVHQITTDGFNALLKTLEEPPEFVKFIFATTQANKVIPTILSRCQRLDFRRISLLEIVGQLEKIVQAEKIKVDKEVLVAIARSSDGSLRDAESILDQLVSFARDKVSLVDIVSMLGLVEQERLFGITEKIIRKDARGVLELLDEVISEGRDASTFLVNMIEHFRNLMIAKIASADSNLIDLPKETCERLLEQSRYFSLDEIFASFNILANTQEVARRLDSLRIPLEIALVRLAHNKKETASSARPDAAKENPGSPPVKKEERAAPPVDNGPIDKKDDPVIEKIEPAAGISLDNIKEAWVGIIEGLGRIKMSVATYLSEGSPVRLEGNLLTVAFSMNHSLHKESLESRENRGIIEKKLAELLHVRLRVNFMLSKDAPQKESVPDNPYLKSIIDTFQGRVVKED